MGPPGMRATCLGVKGSQVQILSARPIGGLTCLRRSGPIFVRSRTLLCAALYRVRCVPGPTNPESPEVKGFKPLGAAWLGQLSTHELGNGIHP